MFIILHTQNPSCHRAEGWGIQEQTEAHLFFLLAFYFLLVNYIVTDSRSYVDLRLTEITLAPYVNCNCGGILLDVSLI